MLNLFLEVFPLHLAVEVVDVEGRGPDLVSVWAPSIRLSHSPRLNSRDKPQIVLSSHQKEETQEQFQILYFRTIPQQDLHKQIIRNISENVHKIIKDQILGTKEIIDSPNRVWSRGKSVPDGVVQSKDQTYTKSMTKLSRGAQFTNLLDNDESWP